MSVKILIADDHKIIRDGIRVLLAKHPDIEIIGEVDNGRQAVDAVVRLKPHVVVMDIGMKDLNGIEATRQIKESSPGTQVLALSMHSDRKFITRMLQAGASGYLLKDCAFEELVDAIRTVRSGKSFLSPSVADMVLRDYVAQLKSKDGSAAEVLTDREREVIQLLAEGKSVKEAAARLFVSVKTVETHRKHIMDKLGLRGAADLTKYAIREGLTSLES